MVFNFLSTASGMLARVPGTYSTDKAIFLVTVTLIKWSFTLIIWPPLWWSWHWWAHQIHWWSHQIYYYYWWLHQIHKIHKIYKILTICLTCSIGRLCLNSVSSSAPALAFFLSYSTYLSSRPYQPIITKGASLCQVFRHTESANSSVPATVQGLEDSSVPRNSSSLKDCWYELQIGFIKTDIDITFTSILSGRMFRLTIYHYYYKLVGCCYTLYLQASVMSAQQWASISLLLKNIYLLVKLLNASMIVTSLILFYMRHSNVYVSD